MHVVRLLLGWQLAASCLLGLIAGFWGKDAALAAGTGGLIAWLPNCYFALRAFRYRGARAAKQIVRSFYAGAAGKMLLTAGLFTVVFINLRPLNAPALFIGFCCVQALGWLVPLMVDRPPAERSV